MRIRKGLFFLGLTISIVAICVISYQLFRYKCVWWNCAPTRKFTVYDLDLPANLFPSGAEIYPLEQDRGVITAVEEARGAGNWDNGGYVYIVYKFATESQAANWFEEDTKDHLITKPLDDSSLYKEILDYQSPVADEHDVICGYILDFTSCMTRARYKEFYIFFNGYITKSGLSGQDYLIILRYIDQRMLMLFS